jgi:ankyrin repeat protein
MSNLQALIEAIRLGNEQETKSILEKNAALANQYDETGATPLHYATLNGHQSIVRMLIERGALVNSADKKFGATPTGWAIEYLRELGGHLGIELEYLRYAIQQGDTKWVSRFLQRFPGLREANYKDGKSFRDIAMESGNPEIINLFE